jgi:hypothetical protein
MSQSQVPTAPNLDILTEIVTDTRIAPSSATAAMQRIFGKLYKAAAQSSTDRLPVLREATRAVDSRSESRPLNKR